MSLSSKPFRTGFDTARPAQREIRPHTFPEFSGTPVPHHETAPPTEMTFEQLRFQGGREVLPHSKEMEIEERIQHAEALVEQARLNADLVQRRAHEEGVAAGRAEGAAAAEARFTGLITALKQQIDGLTAYRSSLLREAEQGALELALAVARRVVHHEISLNRETVAHVIRDAMRQIGDATQTRIRLNPEDFELMNRDWSLFKDHLGQVEGIQFEADEQVDRGGCIVETDVGGIDARMAHQLDTVEQALRSLVI